MVEQLAIDRACELFGADWANVQPHSGSQANGAVYMAMLQPGDTVLGMSLDAGGHLTHGAKPNFSGKTYKAVQYGLDNDTGLIDYEQVEALAREHKPKMIVAGFSAYSQVVDWQRFRDIADEVGAILLVDMAHVAGLVAAGVYPSPVGIADITTTTTHKTLGGPRGGLIMGKANEDLQKKINSAVFPGGQGGPLEHVIAAKAICFKEAMEPEFKTYQQQVVATGCCQFECTSPQILTPNVCHIGPGDAERSGWFRACVWQNTTSGQMSRELSQVADRQHLGAGHQQCFLDISSRENHSSRLLRDCSTEDQCTLNRS